MKRHYFKKGDIVIKKRGTHPWKINEVYGNMLYGKYLGSGSSVNSHHTNVRPYKEEIEQKGTEEMAPAIYKITLEDRETYGTKAGEDSAGRYLMEEKGTGAIIIVPKESVEEVLPYTFAARMNGNTRHFVGSAGSLEVGDLLMYTPDGIDRAAIALVVEVDTKKKGANIFKGRKIVTEKII